MPDAVSITGTQPHPAAETEVEAKAKAEAEAGSSRNPPAQSRGKKVVNSRMKVSNLAKDQQQDRPPTQIPLIPHK